MQGHGQGPGRQAARRCPANTFIGSGKATAVPAGGGNTITTTVKIANGKSGRFEFFFAVGGKDVTGFRATAKGSKLTSQTLTGTLPGGVIVTSLKGSIKKKSTKGKNLITTPKTCPKSKKWKFCGELQVRRRHAQADRHGGC